ncbi:hypothetical protein BX616_005241 [Lobosporangium transversale]|uniref:SH3 domain-containing protein n=1 Tax=Lobosporangium transversale TaxID=64571 RepID=A0A1Y2GVK7_9FUNG|nr:hypothetical protein BCR41DRAFT_246636 [Lobosporangium transversale]KAF9897636.1 hypothetical protein BX616_005241 [Lobosporangium transversale]ORZ23805.1 hypothetical protein BCR41DRAFT_246636 [Lobosporangium transversale]|eukprot:XP_021883619.1 hypothetical protein BCR41DRAFT_246636 [Lobosporangium transversale]
MRYSRYRTSATTTLIILALSLLSTITRALPTVQIQERNVLQLAAPPPTHAPTQPAAPVNPKPSVPSPNPLPTKDPEPTQTQQPDPEPTEELPAQPPSSPSVSEPSSPHPSVPPAPKPSNPNSPPQHSANPPLAKPSATNAITESAVSSVDPVVVLGTAPNAVPTTSASPDDGSGVPTKVSQRVLIGIGTALGTVVIALGGLAFYRNRKKKKLATALLEQTAQFNHNDPYARFSENTKSVKEGVPMTPTKPLGTYTVAVAYIPALADEIELGEGDSITILQEYDDGWCLGINNSRNGIKGVFPGRLLEDYYNTQYTGHDGLSPYPQDHGFRAITSKRISSMPTAGWNNPVVYSGGYSGCLPNPHSHAHYSNGQGYYNNNYSGH